VRASSNAEFFRFRFETGETRRLHHRVRVVGVEARPDASSRPSRVKNSSCSSTLSSINSSWVFFACSFETKASRLTRDAFCQAFASKTKKTMFSSRESLRTQARASVPWAS